METIRLSERKDYTVEVWKADRRTKSGIRMVLKKDHKSMYMSELKHLYGTSWPKKDGYDCRIYETYVTAKNALTGVEFTERYDTPYYASPRSETYWSS